MLVRSIALFALVLAACGGPTPQPSITDDVEDDGSTPPVEEPDELGGGDSPVDGPDAPPAAECPAELGDYPVPYFADTVLIRLPKGMTEDNFVEFTPAFARSTAPIESVVCVDGAAPAIIEYMAMTYFEDDPSKDIATLRDETLEAMGYVNVTYSEETVDDTRRYYIAVIDVPPTADKPETARALLQMKAANGMMYAIIYETSASSWPALAATFRESASRISFLAP